LEAWSRAYQRRPEKSGEEGLNILTVAVKLFAELLQE
jgi:hypothetical protein